MGDEVEQGTSLRDRAFVPPVPSPSVSAVPASIPSAIDVLDALQALGRRSNAVGLCEALRLTGFSVANAQLGIQRAVDRGDIVLEDDFSLTIGAVNMDYVGGSIGVDRWGRKVRGAITSSPFLREEYLVEHGWRETKRGWVKEQGFGKPLPADSAFELQAILDDLDSDSDEHPKGEDAQRLSGAAMPARAEGIANPIPVCPIIPTYPTHKQGEGE